MVLLLPPWGKIGQGVIKKIVAGNKTINFNNNESDSLFITQYNRLSDYQIFHKVRGRGEAFNRQT